jgi:LysR family glycine cleavage system transcriptional activator
MPLTLPPLNALRGFEAPARTGSYVAAAEELGVSAAAISQQIRKLEDYIDLRIGYDPGQYPEHTIVLLQRDVVVPLCSPGYLDRNPAARLKGMEAVTEEDLLHTSWGESFGSHPSWHGWFLTAKLKPPTEGKGFKVGRSSLVLDLAKQGLGVALGQRMMAADDLAAGRLVSLSDISLSLGHPYCLAYPRAKGRKRHVGALVAWLAEGTTARPA